MLYVLLSLLLVGSHAASGTSTISCAIGKDDQVENGVCADCVAGYYKLASELSNCVKKANDATHCATLKRVAGSAGVDTNVATDDSTCAVACDEGYAIAAGGDGAVDTCALNSAVGFGGSPPVACVPGTTFSDAVSLLSVACTAVTPCAAKTAPKAAIPGTASTDEACGCAGGQFGTDCATKCDAGKFLVLGDNVSKDATACVTYTVCKGTATVSAKNADDADEWGQKTAGTAATDAVCNSAKPAAATSSAAVLAIPAFLIALLF